MSMAVFSLPAGFHELFKISYLIRVCAWPHERVINMVMPIIRKNCDSSNEIRSVSSRLQNVSFCATESISCLPQQYYM